MILLHALLTKCVGLHNQAAHQRRLAVTRAEVIPSFQRLCSRQHSVDLLIHMGLNIPLDPKYLYVCSRLDVFKAKSHPSSIVKYHFCIEC